MASGEVVGTYNGTARSVLWPTGLRTWNIAPLACQSLPPSNTADLLLSRWGLMTVEDELHRSFILSVTLERFWSDIM